MTWSVFVFAHQNKPINLSTVSEEQYQQFPYLGTIKEVRQKIDVVWQDINTWDGYYETPTMEEVVTLSSFSSKT